MLPAKSGLEIHTVRIAYLLPCPCGREIPVETTQAGEQITCECGESLEVPTMRDLRVLKRAEAPAAAARPASTWGARQAVLLLGALITLAAVAAVAVTIYRYQTYQTRPKILDADELTPFGTWLLWQQDLRPGIERPFVWQQPLERAQKRYKRRLDIIGVLAGIGVLTMICSLLIPKQGPRRRKRPPRGP